MSKMKLNSINTVIGNMSHMTEIKVKVKFYVSIFSNNQAWRTGPCQGTHIATIIYFFIFL